MQTRVESPYKKIRTPLILIGVIIAIGTVGYIKIEGYGLLEALFMTIITISTVGYGLVKPLSEAGKAFTILLILLNIGTIAYLLTLVTQYVFDGSFLKDYKLYKMHKGLKKITDHVIICGYGRNGKSAAEALQANSIPYVIIELDPKIVELDASRDLFIHGDATQEQSLIQAGLPTARALITTLPDDANNVFTILTAKELNPSILVISRASNDSAISKLKHAGASNVIMPDKIGGTQMAQLVNSPDLKEFVDTLSFQNNAESSLEEIIIRTEIECKKVEILTRYNVLILSIKGKDDQFDFTHSPKILVPGNRIVVLGKKQDIDRLKNDLISK